MSRTKAVAMSQLPNVGLDTPNRWSSKHQFESYTSLGYEADTENEGRAGAKEQKDSSWLDYFDPNDPEHMIWSWPKEVQYLGTSPKGASLTQPLSKKVEERTPLGDRKANVQTEKIEKVLKPPVRFGSPASESLRARTLLPDLGEELRCMDECDDMTIETSYRPSPMHFLRVNRECVTGDFEHYCTNDVGEEDSELCFMLPTYSATGETSGEFGSGNKLGGGKV